MSPEELHHHLIYKPDTGQLIRRSNMKPVYLEKRHSQYTMQLGGRRISARRVVVAMQTGRWPDAHEYRFTGGNPTDLRWCNFLRIKDGEMRRCNRCGEMKHQSEFRPSGKGARSFTPHCIPCNRDRERAYNRASSLKRDYGVTRELYNEQLEIQGGGCAICGKTPEQEGKELAVDHCHDTGKVRAILCNQCNIGLGAFGDSPRRLLEAAKYLLKHKPE